MWNSVSLWNRNLFLSIFIIELNAGMGLLPSYGIFHCIFMDGTVFVQSNAFRYAMLYVWYPSDTDAIYMTSHSQSNNK